VELLKELAARLKRQRLLRYTCRELEMQRLLMAKGGRKKLSGVEPMAGEDREEDEDEDEIDSRKGRHQPSTMIPVEERAYKPRVYKWRMERKR
jgi:U3 small nucleolar RNA-associated protein 11